MVKIKKSSNELNRFLSCVYISPQHAASSTGLDKLYRAKESVSVCNEKRNTKMGRK